MVKQTQRNVESSVTENDPSLSKRQNKKNKKRLKKTSKDTIQTESKNIQEAIEEDEEEVRMLPIAAVTSSIGEVIGFLKLSITTLSNTISSVYNSLPTFSNIKTSSGNLITNINNSIQSVGNLRHRVARSYIGLFTKITDSEKKTEDDEVTAIIGRAIGSNLSSGEFNLSDENATNIDLNDVKGSNLFINENILLKIKKNSTKVDHLINTVCKKLTSLDRKIASEVINLSYEDLLEDLTKQCDELLLQKVRTSKALEDKLGEYMSSFSSNLLFNYSLEHYQIKDIVSLINNRQAERIINLTNPCIEAKKNAVKDLNKDKQIKIQSIFEALSDKHENWVYDIILISLNYLREPGKYIVDTSSEARIIKSIIAISISLHYEVHSGVDANSTCQIIYNFLNNELSNVW